MSGSRSVVLFVVLFLNPFQSNAQDFDGIWYTRDDDLHRYFFTFANFNWTEARDLCSTMGGYLLTIGSDDENEFLDTITAESGYHWIGLHGTCDSSGCHSFNWLVTEGSFYQDWQPGFPDDDFTDECVNWCIT